MAIHTPDTSDIMVNLIEVSEVERLRFKKLMCSNNGIDWNYRTMFLMIPQPKCR